MGPGPRAAGSAPLLERQRCVHLHPALRARLRVARPAIKVGIVPLTKQLVAEGARSGIRANCVSPGIIETPATLGDLLSEDHPMKGIPTAIPLGRIGQAAEVVRCARFLATAAGSPVAHRSRQPPRQALRSVRLGQRRRGAVLLIPLKAFSFVAILSRQSALLFRFVLK